MSDNTTSTKEQQLTAEHFISQFAELAKTASKNRPTFNDQFYWSLYDCIAYASQLPEKAILNSLTIKVLFILWKRKHKLKGKYAGAYVLKTVCKIAIQFIRRHNKRVLEKNDHRTTDLLNLKPEITEIWETF